MTQEKHTPGPWQVFGRMTGRVVSENGPGMVEICETGDFRDAELVPFNAARWNADARLIAAAPDMLEALQAAQSMHQRYCDRVGASDGWARTLKSQIDAAITKATGEMP